MFSEVINTVLSLMTLPLAKGRAMADRGKSNVADIQRRIAVEDRYMAVGSLWAIGAHGGILLGNAWWNWRTLLSTLTGNLISVHPTILYSEEIAAEAWKNKTNCYIATMFQNYIPCGTALPMEYKAHSLVFEYTTYVSQATVFSTLPWMIPHFLNLLWLFLNVMRL